MNWWSVSWACSSLQILYHNLSRGFFFVHVPDLSFFWTRIDYDCQNCDHNCQKCHSSYRNQSNFPGGHPWAGAGGLGRWWGLDARGKEQLVVRICRIVEAGEAVGLIGDTTWRGKTWKAIRANEVVSCWKIGEGLWCSVCGRGRKGWAKLEGVIGSRFEDGSSGRQVDGDVFGGVEVDHLGQLVNSFGDVDIFVNLDSIFLESHVERNHWGETIAFPHFIAVISTCWDRESMREGGVECDGLGGVEPWGVGFPEG